jgi:CDP-glucose 4,6-dehydratase
MGANVLGYSLEAPTEPNHLALLDLKMTSIIGDILDVEHLNEVFERHKPEIVFHLAAQSLVRYSYREPIETFSVNVQGTVNVLEVCRKSPTVKAVINVTTDKCYENKEHLQAYVESDPLGGHDPYSASKACSELVTASYRKSFTSANQFLIASARAGNVIGGGDWAEDRLIPDMVKALQAGQTTEIRSPGAVRPWQHVLEPLSGYLLLGQKLLEGEQTLADAWNFGPFEDEDLSVGEVAQELQKYWGFRIDLGIKKQTLHEASILKLNCSKARNELHWYPVWGSEEMLEKTVCWYRDFYEKEVLLTREQLDQYIAQARAQKIVWAE